MSQPEFCSHGTPYRYPCEQCDFPGGLVRSSGLVRNLDPTPLKNDAAIQQAVDDYLLMERKARVLDEIERQLRARVEKRRPG